MSEFLTTSNIMFVIGIFGLVFTIWGKVTAPQVKADKLDALLKQHIEFLTAGFNEKFNSVDKQIANLTDNHIHTLTVGQTTTNDTVQKLAIEVAKLTTIIDERIPKK